MLLRQIFRRTTVPRLGRRVLVVPDVLEKPLPRSRRSLEGYASVHVLEALLEMVPATVIAEKGFHPKRSR